MDAKKDGRVLYTPTRIDLCDKQVRCTHTSNSYFNQRDAYVFQIIQITEHYDDEDFFRDFVWSKVDDVKKPQPLHKALYDSLMRKKYSREELSRALSNPNITEKDMRSFEKYMNQQNNDYFYEIRDSRVYEQFSVDHLK